MHGAAFQALGIDAGYEAWDVPPAALEATVAKLQGEGMLGANVSVPHKETVGAYLDDLRDAARAVGAVNLIVREGDRLVGDNSDAAGFAGALEEAGVDVPGRRAVLLGAGGAARAVAWSLLQDGVAEIAILNRTRERAEVLRDAFADGAGEGQLRVIDDPRDAMGSDLWVQTTTLGMQQGGENPETTPIDEAAWGALLAGARDPVAVDVVYRPRVTPFLRHAAAAGARTVDGAGMLLHQGVVAFEAWTGREAPLEVMRRALQDALQEGN